MFLPIDADGPLHKMPMELLLRIVDRPSKAREYLFDITHAAIKGTTVNARFAYGQMNQYLDTKVRERLANPGDDLMRSAIALKVDDEPLSQQQVAIYNDRHARRA